MRKTSSRTKVIIDTNIYIPAIFWGGNPRKVIDLARDQKIAIYTSDEIISEIQEVLGRKFSLEEDDIVQILFDLRSFTQLVQPTETVVFISEDPADDKFLTCAKSAGAHYIVSGDHHLLKIKKFQNTQIVSSSDFLKIIND